MLTERAINQVVKEADSLVQTGRGSEALYILESSAVELLNCLALNYAHVLNDLSKAERILRSAINFLPGHYPLYTNLTHILSSADKPEEALHFSKKSVESLNYPICEAYYNQGVVLTDLCMDREATNAFRQSLKANPNHFNSQYNMALCLMRHGEWEEGWKWYESRFNVDPILNAYYQRFPGQHWDGQKHRGKTICVFSEQGMGDVVMNARFLPWLKKYFKKTIIEIQEPLADIIDANLLRVDKVITRPNTTDIPPKPQADYYVSINSLPGKFGVFNEEKIPQASYIFAPKRPKHHGFSKKFVNVGLCWAGNGNHKKDNLRSLVLEWFRPMAELPHIRFFSLQKDSPGSRKWGTQWVNLEQGRDTFPMTDLAKELNTIGDLAHLINYLDLVISVDTSVAHVAGAMGKPVWNLLSYRGEWRWGLNPEHTAWYPSMKLFRQPSYGDWQTPINQAYKELSSRKVSSWRTSQD